jgi:hypothetical protein
MKEKPDSWYLKFRGKKECETLNLFETMEKPKTPRQEAEEMISEFKTSEKITQMKGGVEVETQDFKKSGTGLRYNEGKSRVDLIDAEFMVGVGRVMRLGSLKYAENNWRGGMKWSICIGCLLRHVFAFMRGEDKDPETGEHHLLHAACNVMFLYWYTIHRTELDDRFKMD